MSITSEFMSTSSMFYRGFHIMCVQLSSVDLGVIGSCVVNARVFLFYIHVGLVNLCMRA